MTFTLLNQNPEDQVWYDDFLAVGNSLPIQNINQLSEAEFNLVNMAYDDITSALNSYWLNPIIHGGITEIAFFTYENIPGERLQTFGINPTQNFIQFLNNEQIWIGIESNVLNSNSINPGRLPLTILHEIGHSNDFISSRGDELLNSLITSNLDFSNISSERLDFLRGAIEHYLIGIVEIEFANNGTFDLGCGLI